MSIVHAVNESPGLGWEPVYPSAPALLRRARHVNVRGLGTAVVHEGERPDGAPTLILLHGLGATAALNWYTSFPALTDHHHVVAPDLRGHGQGVRAGVPFTLEDAADDVVAIADALGIERFVPVGYSMGGPIAQLVWRRHHDRVSGIVLCATAYRFRSTPREHVMFATLPALGQVSRIVPDAIQRQVVSQVSRSYLSETGFGEWARNEMLRRDPRAVLEAAIELGKYSVQEWIGEIDVPTSVVVHARDQVVPPRRQLELASAVPGATTHVVDADHFAVIRDRERFVNTLVRAVRSVTDRADPLVATAGRSRSALQPAA
jgi:3-oxoadipate enol-lactonase